MFVLHFYDHTMSLYPPLHLPPCSLRFGSDRGRQTVLDPLRRKYVALTPEEWVRQHFVHYLLSEKGVPAELTANEVPITLNSLSRRCDTVVYNRQLRPLAIVEYKAPSVAITQRVFEQIARYNMVLAVPFLLVSNGLRHFCFRQNQSMDAYLPMDHIPAYDEMLLALDQRAT